MSKLSIAILLLSNKVLNWCLACIPQRSEQLKYNVIIPFPSRQNMNESTDRNACILLISQPSTEKVLENIEMEEKAPDEPSIHKSPTDLLNLASYRMNENKLKVARSSSLTSRLSVGLRSINSQVMDLPGTLSSIYILCQ